MDSTHVIALIASNLMVRNQLAVAACMTEGERKRALDMLGDPIEEARELIRQVMSDEPKLPAAPNTMARGGVPEQ